MNPEPRSESLVAAQEREKAMYDAMKASFHLIPKHGTVLVQWAELGDGRLIAWAEYAGGDADNILSPTDNVTRKSALVEHIEDFIGDFMHDTDVIIRHIP